MKDKVIQIPASELGPRNAEIGSRMYVGWSNYTKVYVWDGVKWVLEERRFR